MAIRIEKGQPTDEELAAAVAVLLSRAGVPAQPSTQPMSRWAASGRPGVRLPDGRSTLPTAGAWRACALPR